MQENVIRPEFSSSIQFHCHIVSNFVFEGYVSQTETFEEPPSGKIQNLTTRDIPVPRIYDLVMN